MHKRTSVLASLLATLALALAITATASAGRLSISNTSFRQVWRPLTFATGTGESGITVRCNVTLEGSFHYNTIVKVARSLIGYVTRAIVEHSCTGGEGWTLNGVERPTNTLPWHLTYEGFEGTLPNITGIRALLRLAFAIEVSLGLCLYEGNSQGVPKLSRGVVSGVVPDNTVAIPKRSGGIFCPNSGFFSQEVGASSITTLLGNTQSITITLI